MYKEILYKEIEIFYRKFTENRKEGSEIFFSFSSVGVSKFY